MELFEVRNMRPHVEWVNQLMTGVKTVLVFDTETTGLCERDKVIQFSAILYQMHADKLEELDRINYYINPEMPLDPVITDITGITEDDLINALPEEKMIDKIDDFMNRAQVWAGYNVSFDMGMMQRMHERCHKKWDPKPAVDVLAMARNCIFKSVSGVKNYKLGTITGFLFPDMEVKFHDSLEDVRATAQCFEALLKDYKTKTFDDSTREDIYVTFASFWQNPHNPGQRRIKVFNGRNDTGIFWDCGKYCWSCKKDKQSKNNFLTKDIASIEKQVLFRYGKIYEADTMEDLARNWGNAIREKEKQRTAEKAKKEEPAPVSIPEPSSILEKDEGEIELW